MLKKERKRAMDAESVLETSSQSRSGVNTAPGRSHSMPYNSSAYESTSPNKKMDSVQLEMKSRVKGTFSYSVF